MRSHRQGERIVRFRRRLLLGGWLVVVALLGWRALEVQVMDAPRWQALAEGQHRMSSAVPAPRGTILDREGTPLAVSHETYAVGIAPGEVRDPEATAELLAGELDLPLERARALTTAERAWVVAPGRYPAHVREAVAATRGVYVERELRRSYPREALVRGLLGSVVDGRGVDGVELAFDDLLRGEPGTQVVARDSSGESIPGKAWIVTPPRPGGRVALSLDTELQEIAQQALAEAVDESGAAGGELLVTDPRSGEILAAVSRSREAPRKLSLLNTTFEPGSTLKPFTVAALLSHGLADLADTVDVMGGRWTVHGRTISDVSVHDTLSLRDALRVSSNVGVARLAERLSPEQQYETLRDFGFGTPTGIGIPGEVGGVLRRPDRWSRQSPASLAIGYEIAVTPLQLAMAYGALANGGRLMEPLLVREVRRADGTVVERNDPRVVRQVVETEVARSITAALVDVVEDGTGTRARLGSFQVAGKSGTTRAHGPAGYQTGGHYASFISFFPAESPQLLVFVQLDRPRGEYYGGAAAAPVSRATMEAVLAARRSPLDRDSLANFGRRATADAGPRAPEHRRDGGRNAGQDGGRDPARASRAEPGPDPNRLVSAVVSRDAAPLAASVPVPVSGAEESGEDDGVQVPDVGGLPVRDAVRRLHGHGFRVEWDGSGEVGGTVPAAGDLLAPGDTVRLVGAQDRATTTALAPGRDG